MQLYWVYKKNKDFKKIEYHLRMPASFNGKFYDLMLYK
jgi:hypothetical protein